MPGLIRFIFANDILALCYIQVKIQDIVDIAGSYFGPKFADRATTESMSIARSDFAVL